MGIRWRIELTSGNMTEDCVDGDFLGRGIWYNMEDGADVWGFGTWKSVDVWGFGTWKAVGIWYKIED